jgi:hypothetical protein
MVTAGVLGSISASAAPADVAASQSQDADTAQAITRLGQTLQRIAESLEYGQRGPVVASGFMAEIRERLQIHLRSAGKFPEFMEIGCTVFWDVYDWHIRYGQPIQITRISEQRFAIQWMFTQLILRWEQDPKYLGTPFDRG